MKRGQPSDPLLRALAWDRFWAMIYQETKTMLIERALAEQEEEEKQQQQQQQQQKSA